jgi:hypothetical protein
LSQARRYAGAPWALSNSGFSMALVRPKGLLLHGETASVDAPPARAPTRLPITCGEDRRWEKRSQSLARPPDSTVEICLRCC